MKYLIEVLGEAEANRRVAKVMAQLIEHGFETSWDEAADGLADAVREYMQGG